MKKRILSMVLCLCMVLTLLPTGVLATGGAVTPGSWSEVQTVINSMQDGDILDLSGVNRSMGAEFDTLTVNKSITIQGENTTGHNATKAWNSAYNLRIVITDNAHVTLKNMYFLFTEYATDPNSGDSIVSGTGNLTIDGCFLGCNGLYYGQAQTSYTPAPVIDISGDVTINGEMTADATNGTTEIIGAYLDGSMTASSTGAAGIGVRATGKVTVNGGEISGGTCNSAKYPGGTAIVAGSVEINGAASTIATNKFSTCIFGGNGGTQGGAAIEADGSVAVNGGKIMGGSSSAEKGGDCIVAKGDVAIQTQTTGDVILQSGKGAASYSPGSIVVLQPVDGAPERTLTIDNATAYTRNAPTNGTASIPFVMQENDKAIINKSDVGWSSSDPLFSAGWFKITNPVSTRGNFLNAKSIALEEAKTAAGAIVRNLYTTESLAVLDAAVSAAPTDFSDTTTYKGNAGVTKIDTLAQGITDAIAGLVSAEPVAKIGEIEYMTLAAAITAAETGNTIVLLKSCTQANTQSITKDITIQVNDGVTFTVKYDTDISNVTTVCNADIIVKNGGTLTLNNAGGFEADCLIFNGDLTVDAGGTVKTTVSGFAGTILLQGTLTNNGGIDAAAGNFYVAYGTTNTGTFTNGSVRYNLCIKTRDKTTATGDTAKLYITGVVGTVAVGETLHPVLDGFGEIRKAIPGLNFIWDNDNNGGNTFAYTVPASKAGSAITVRVNGSPSGTVAYFIVDDTTVTNVTTPDSTGYTTAAVTKKEIIVTFNANGGTCGTATLTVDETGKLASLPTPTRSGSYTFDGWYTLETGGTQITTETVFTDSETVYAHWTYTGGSSGGSSGSGGGGATAPSVTVPVSFDEGKVSVSASVSGGTATIAVTDQQLAEIASNTADTGTVTVDLSGLKNVDSAKIPAKVITAANTATGSDGLEIILPTGRVKLDETALASVASANKEIAVSVEKVKPSSLTAA